MKQKVLKILFICLIVLTPKSFADESTQRIVSLLPSSTEILYAIGAGDRIVGVTRYCIFPEEAKQNLVVGGLLDPNFELIYSLNPDLIIIQDNEGEQTALLKEMDIPLLEIETRSIKGIVESIRAIGSAVGEEKNADNLINSINTKIESIQSKVKDKPKPRVLITFLREVGEGKIKEVYIAGNFTFFNDLIEIVGGENAYQGPRLVTSPILTPEGILKINPDVIIEVMGTLDLRGYAPEEAMTDWNMLQELKAYKSKRIHIIPKQYAGIPGPRITQTLDEMARYVHPKIDWDKKE